MVQNRLFCPRIQHACHKVANADASFLLFFAAYHLCGSEGHALGFVGKVLRLTIVMLTDYR